MAHRRNMSLVPNERATEPDISEITESIEQQRQQLEATLSAYGEIGKRVFDEFVSGLPLEELCRTIASGRQHHAVKVVNAIFARLSALVCDVALRTQDAERAIQTGKEIMSAFETVIDSEDPRLKFCCDWGATAENLIALVDQASKLEEEIRNRLGYVTTQMSSADDLVCATQPAIRDARLFLEDQPESFRVKALLYQGDLTQREQMQADIATAREHIEMCRLHAREAHEKWRKVDDYVEQTIRPYQQAIGALADKLTTVRKQWRDCDQWAGSFGLTPNLYPPEKPWITTETFERAEGYIREDRWAPETFRLRLMGLVAAAFNLKSSIPSLGEELESILESAQQHIERIEAEWKEGFSLPQATSAKTDRADTPVRQATPAKRDSRIDAQVETLWEFSVCLAYVRTFNNEVRLFTTVDVLLKLLQRLGKISDSNTPLVRDLLSERIRREGQFETLQATQVGSRWSQSKALWIGYSVMNTSGALKLSRNARAMVVPLFDKHGLRLPELNALWDEYDKERKKKK
jgi:hypothetical protein